MLNPLILNTNSHSIIQYIFARVTLLCVGGGHCYIQNNGMWLKQTLWLAQQRDSLKGQSLIQVILYVQTFETDEGRGGSMSQVLDYLMLTTHTSLSPIRRGFAPGFVNYKKGCTRLEVASDKVYQLLAHGQWFCPATLWHLPPLKLVAMIQLKVALNTIDQINQIKLKLMSLYICIYI